MVDTVDYLTDTDDNYFDTVGFCDDTDDNVST